MPATEMVVMIAVVSAGLLAAIHILRFLTALMLNRTIRKAINRNPEMAESLLDRLAQPLPTGDGDERTAVLLIATGVAMVVASLIIGDTGWMHYAIAGAVFPLIIGSALWARYLVARKRRAGRE